MVHASCDECEPGAGGFCGVDGHCHQYTCESFYEFGPRNFTGYDDASPSELVCGDIPTTEPRSTAEGSVDYPSVSFRCVSLTPTPISLGFTRRCIAATSPNSNFTCYGLAANTHFQSFRTAASAGLNCTDTTYNETGWPKFAYRVVTERKGDVTSAIHFLHGFNATAEFNETRALTGSIYSKYEWTDESISTPTTSPASSTYPSVDSALSNRQIISNSGFFVGISCLASLVF